MDNLNSEFVLENQFCLKRLLKTEDRVEMHKKGKETVYNAIF